MKEQTRIFVFVGAFIPSRTFLFRQCSRRKLVISYWLDRLVAWIFVLLEVDRNRLHYISSYVAPHNSTSCDIQSNGRLFSIFAWSFSCVFAAICTKKKTKINFDCNTGLPRCKLLLLLLNKCVINTYEGKLIALFTPLINLRRD